MVGCSAYASEISGRQAIGAAELLFVLLLVIATLDCFQFEDIISSCMFYMHDDSH